MNRREFNAALIGLFTGGPHIFSGPRERTSEEIDDIIRLFCPVGPISDGELVERFDIGEKSLITNAMVDDISSFYRSNHTTPTWMSYT